MSKTILMPTIFLARLFLGCGLSLFGVLSKNPKEKKKEKVLRTTR
jgi:hypothetical protein